VTMVAKMRGKMTGKQIKTSEKVRGKRPSAVAGPGSGREANNN